MNRIYSLLIYLLLPGVLLHAQRRERQLEADLKESIAGFHGRVGIYVKNLKNGKIAAVDADTLFPTASMVKIPILVGIADKIQQGALQYHQPLVYRDSLLYEGVDILGSFKDSETIELSKVMMLMCTMSDNTASLWLQQLAGTGTRINGILDSLGFQYTRVNSRTPGRRPDWEVFGWGQSTPRELATLLESIYRRRVISPAACERMLRDLKRNYWDAEALSAFPPSVNVFSKNGAVNESRGEVMLVNAPHGDFLLCIMTKSQEDSSWTYHNEGWDLIRRVATLVWNFYEPKSNWEPMKEPDTDLWF